jgi:hypothetical protein
MEGLLGEEYAKKKKNNKVCTFSTPKSVYGQEIEQLQRKREIYRTLKRLSRD